MIELPLRMQDLVDLLEREDPAASPLERLADAVAVAERLHDMGDDLVLHFVDLARRSEASWAEIGQRLGVTKQAAQKRFGARQRRRRRGGLFARFTRAARAVVVTAQEEARRRGHSEIDTRHVLLGLLDQRDALAAQVLEDVGASPDGLREAVAADLPESEAASPRHIPFSPDAKKALELALREAIRLGHNYIGTEHVLLALLRDPGTGAARILHEAGVRRGEVDRKVLEALEEE